MAEEVVIKVGVDAAPARTTVKGLKSDLKELVDQQANVAKGGKLWKALAKEINDVEGEIGDLTDSFKTLTGSGVDRVNASVGLLKEGFASFDMGKIGVGLKGLGSAFKAVLPFALIQGVMYLVENFEELSKGSGFLAKALRFVGDIIDSIGDKINWLTDKLGLTNTALDKQGELITENAEKNQEALNETIAAYDRQIKAAQAAGKSTVALEKAKQQAIIDTNRLIAEQIANFVRAGGVLDDEKKKQLTAALNTIKNAVNEQQVIEIKADTDKQKRNEEADKKKKELADNSRKDLLKLMSDSLAEDEKANAEDLKNTDDRFKEKQRLAEANAEAQRNLDKFNREQKEKEDKIADDKEKARKKELEDAKFQLAKNSLSAAQGLSDLFFEIQLNQAKAGSAQEREIKRKQFDLNKAFQAGQATIDGYRAVLSAYATAPPGFKIGSAIAAGVFAAANVAKILNTNFNGGALAVEKPTEATATASIPTTSAPTVNTTAPTTQASTTFDEQGRNNNFNRVYVVESDISRVQNRVAKIAEQATI